MSHRTSEERQNNGTGVQEKLKGKTLISMPKNRNIF